MAKTAKDLSTNATQAVAAKLNQSLADTVVTTMLAQNFHWNVKGMAFGSLHGMFQEIYEDHFLGQDDLAERMRALGAMPEGTLAGHLRRAKVTEGDSTAKDVDMVKALSEAEEILAQSLADVARTAADAGDGLTEDLAIARGAAHEKFAWMLRAHLG